MCNQTGCRDDIHTKIVTFCVLQFYSTYHPGCKLQHISYTHMRIEIMYTDSQKTFN